jgi:hypothetical protein
LFILFIRLRILSAGFSILLLDLGGVNEENKTKRALKTPSQTAGATGATPGTHGGPFS